MSSSILKRTLTKGFGRRILGLFLFAAIVPMMFTAGLAYSEFNRGLKQEAARTLKNSAKQYGVEILSRIERAEGKSVELMKLLQRHGDQDFVDHDYLLNEFAAIWKTDEQGKPLQTLLGAPLDISIDAWKSAKSQSTKTQLFLVDERHPVLLQRQSDTAAPNRQIAFQLNLEKIWADRENLPFETEFCVSTPAGTLLHCTRPVDANIHAAVVAQGDTNRSSIFAEMPLDDETQYLALWQLFLSGKYGAEPFDIIAIQPRSVALKSGADFRRIFIPAVMLVLVLVAFLSLNYIARNLTPLRNLTIAAQQVASGNLDSRVRVRTEDEFQWLADAFNNMASKISHQIAALKAMSKIDQMILTGDKLDEVSEGVARQLIALTGCVSAGVLARAVDAPSVGKMVSLHDGEVYRDRVQLPDDAGHQWCQPRQVSLDLVRDAPYADRFNDFGQKFVVLIPVILESDLKGLLLLGFDHPTNMNQAGSERIVDLAGRFAVALASVEREEALYRQAHYDPLTLLPNRQLLKDRLSQHLADSRSDGTSGGLLFLDLDRFKEINDVFGHTIGDEILSQAAKRILSVVRERDTVARLGGDEFVVILPNIRDEAVVRATAERLLNVLSEAFTVIDADHYLSASIGIVIFPDDGATVETLLKNADAAMYRAKDAGRSRFEFFSKRLNAESRRKIGIERDLRAAFLGGELDVHYQPQFDISSGEISGAEALLRWDHPEKGSISPAEFIPLAEDSELIVEIGGWVIERVCENLSQILKKGFHPGPVSINVSGRQLADVSFKKAVMEPIRKYGIHPGFVQLEVTETAVAQNREKAMAILQALRLEGVRVAIDDFGTGYSSLSYLQQLPFDVIKIDKSFVDKIGSNVTSDNICRTIIKMAEQLGKKSIAEGAEEKHQVEFLRQNGCDFVQGFFYAKAMPNSAFVEFIAKQDFHTQRRKALEIVK